MDKGLEVSGTTTHYTRAVAHCSLDGPGIPAMSVAHASALRLEAGPVLGLPAEAEVGAGSELINILSSCGSRGMMTTYMGKPVRDQLRRLATATHAITPLREARNRVVPEVPRSRTRIAALEAELQRLLNAIAPEHDLQSYAEARDLLDNQRIAMILAFTLAPDSNCIDVGCHKGEMLADMLRLAPEGRHLAFEPIPYMYDALRKRFPHVDVRQSALSNRSGEAEFKHVTNLPGYSGLRERSYPGDVKIETITVRTERLDDVVPEDWVPALIKIDVEGAEQLVIEGALEMIHTHRPTVIFEHGLGASDRYSTRPSDIYRPVAR